MHRQLAKIAIRMMMGIGMPSRNNRIERMGQAPVVCERDACWKRLLIALTTAKSSGETGDECADQQ